MAGRKQFESALSDNPELQQLLEKARNTKVSEAELREQRVSFAFGNAPADSKLITRQTVQYASENIRLK